jgi:hypothetical protein
MNDELIESGIPWIGKYPKGWRTGRVKSVFFDVCQQINEKDLAKQEIVCGVLTSRNYINII